MTRMRASPRSSAKRELLLATLAGQGRRLAAGLPVTKKRFETPPTDVSAASGVATVKGAPGAATDPEALIL
jgi:hypothetical protein